MINFKVLDVFIAALLTSYSVLAQYDTYERGDEIDNVDERSPVDYSKYFDGVGGAGGPVTSPQAIDHSNGFVQPLDFTGFFAGGHFGLDGLAGGASQQVFQTPGGGLALPNPSGSFILQPEQDLNNSSGFVNGINFKSLFDTSTSPSEHGFRPHDFLPRTSQSQSKYNPAFYSPGFDSLQRDVDREVDHQRKEEKVIEQSRHASRRVPDDEDSDDDLDDYDSSEVDSHEPTLLDPNDRSPQKYTKQPYEDEREYGNSNTKQISYETPHSQVNHYHNPPPEPRNRDNNKRIPLPTLYESDEEYVTPALNRKDNSYIPVHSSHKNRLSQTNARNNYRNKNIRHSSPIIENNKHNTNNRISHLMRPEGDPGRGTHLKKYASRLPNQPTRAHSLNTYTNRAPSDFKPSPRDPYRDSIRAVHNGRRANIPKYPEPFPGTNYSPRITELPTVNSRHPAQPITAASENKSCRRINKKIDTKEFPRFKRQQMTCYICKNKEKGNTYEECTYESEPKGKSFYKGSTESYSSDELLSPTVFQIRERRSPNWPNKNKPTIDSEKYSARNHRGYSYNGNDEKGHGNEHYLFGPEYFENDESNSKRQPNRNPRRYDDESDEYEDESEIEKEYTPPGVSDDDNCEKVNKNGLICMVCENPKSGGSYEQCSYASDPETNKYEYAKHTTYGSKRRPDRYKRYLEDGYKRKNVNKHKDKNGRKITLRDNDERYNNYRNKKLKRKKVNSRDLYNKAIKRSDNKRNRVRDSEVNSEMPGIVGLDPFFYGSPGETYNPDEYDERGKKLKSYKNEQEDDEAEASTVDESGEAIPTYEESFFKLFPELEGTDPYTGEPFSSDRKDSLVNETANDYVIPYVGDEVESESKQRTKKVKPDNPYGVELPSYYFDDDESKKDLEKALDEFVHKNRSNCKKVMKEEMTCYQCVNTKGMQHEECMFVVASEPQNKHLAYHEVKEFRVTPKENGTKHVSSNKEEPELASNDESMGVITETTPSSQNILTDRTLKPLRTESEKIPSRKLMKRSKLDVVPKVKNAFNHKVPSFKQTNNTNHFQIDDILRLRPRGKQTKTTIIRRKTNDSLGELARKKRKPNDTEIAAESRSRYKNARRHHENPNTKYNAEDGGKEDAQGDAQEEVEDEGGNEDENKESSTENISKGRSYYNSVPTDPEGFDEREGPEGAYSHETEPVYDARLKITLPKYMLTRSEHEEIFDEVLRSG